MESRYHRSALSREQTRIRVLAIERMLAEGRALSASQILRRLDMQYDIQADRKTIYNDIKAIDRFHPIETVSGRNGGFKRCEFDCEEEKIANEKPCLTCRKVDDPANCENKLCQAWRSWFLEKWGELHNGKWRN